MATFERIRVIDSHTGGEPTRVVIDGGPDLGSGSLAERRDVFRTEFDWFRSAVVNEPRGSDAVVGGLLCEPGDSSCTAGVIFFNNVDCLNMCVHGTIGLVVTLAHMNRIGPGEHRIETPVGVVTTTLHDSGQVTVKNVPAYRSASGIEIRVDGYGPMTGDVAWGGNWFFLVEDHRQAIAPDNVERLTDCAWAIRRTLQKEGITGEDGGEIDHVELFGPPSRDDCHSKNFVLCPGGAYDRSPCGTGTSAKLACLYADGKLEPGRTWRQESIVGSVFEGAIEPIDDELYPHITGSAFVTAEATLLVDPRDPFRHGLRL